MEKGENEELQGRQLHPTNDSSNNGTFAILWKTLEIVGTIEEIFREHGKKKRGVFDFTRNKILLRLWLLFYIATLHSDIVDVLSSNEILGVAASSFFRERSLITAVIKSRRWIHSI